MREIGSIKKINKYIPNPTCGVVFLFQSIYMRETHFKYHMINSQQRLFKEHLVLVNPLWQQKVGNQYISNETAFFYQL